MLTWSNLLRISCRGACVSVAPSLVAWEELVLGLLPPVVSAGVGIAELTSDCELGRETVTPFKPPLTLLTLPCLELAAGNRLMSCSNAAHFSSGRLGFFLAR